MKRCLQVFARDPRPGQVKTRLIPALGELGATAIYRLMLQDTLQVASSTTCERHELWVDQANPGPWLAQLAQAQSLQIQIQVGADLGERMQHALSSALLDCSAAVLIGSDCPQYHTGYIEAAFEALEHYPAVIGPAADGGYVLIGMCQAQPRLFSGIPWSSDQVLHETRLRLESLGLKWHELPTLHDLDEPADLARFTQLATRASVRSNQGD